MKTFSPNPLFTLQRAFRSKSKVPKVFASGTLLAVAAWLLIDYFFHETERIRQLLLGLAALLYFLIDAALRIEEEERLEARVDQAERAAVEHPDKPGPLWDAARARLELYFQRNLSQIRSIFWITCVVMVAGFVMVGYGLSTTEPGQELGRAALAVGAGLLTEFIAATFIVVYKSTMAQANTFVETLERINSVGMAIQILDSIPDSEWDIKSSARASLVTEILRQAPGGKVNVNG